MIWIETVEPEDASGELAAIYRAIDSARGGIAAVHRAQSLHPRALRAHLELYKAVVLGSASLDRRARERIAVVVSHANRCAYCVAHHGEALRRLGEDPAVVDALTAGLIPGALGRAEQSLLAWATRGGREPSTLGASDVAALREAGLDDRAILDAALTVAYFSFVNRLVLMLGVELEPDFERTCAEREPG